MGGLIRQRRIDGEDVVLPVRDDPAGSGDFGASRGDRIHEGIDFVCEPGVRVLSPVAGEVTKVGYAYADDLSWRYVEVTCPRGYAHRVFYVAPAVYPGCRVTTETALGMAQDITARYPESGMTPHVHYEVRREGEAVDPRGVVTVLENRREKDRSAVLSSLEQVCEGIRGGQLDADAMFCVVLGEECGLRYVAESKNTLELVGAVEAAKQSIVARKG